MDQQICIHLCPPLSTIDASRMLIEKKNVKLKLGRIDQVLEQVECKTNFQSLRNEVCCCCLHYMHLLPLMGMERNRIPIPGEGEQEVFQR